MLSIKAHFYSPHLYPGSIFNPQILLSQTQEQYQTFGTVFVTKILIAECFFFKLSKVEYFVD